MKETGSSGKARHRTVPSDGNGDDKIDFLAKLSKDVSSKLAEQQDDGIVHFYEHYEDEGTGNDGKCRVVFPTGFQHASGGPQTALEAAHSDAGAARDVSNSRAEEELVKEERRRKREFVEKCLREEEAAELAAKSGAPESQSLSDKTKGGRSFSSAGVGLRDADGREGHSKHPPATTDSFGAGLFSRGFLDKPSGTTRRKGSDPKLPSDGGTESRPQSRPVDEPPREKKVKASRRVSFAEGVTVLGEPGMKPQNPETADHTQAGKPGQKFESAMLSKSAPPESASILDWIEGATDLSDDVLTAERMSYMEQLIALNDQLAVSDEECASDADEHEELRASTEERGFISKVLGPDSTIPHGVTPSASDSSVSKTTGDGTPGHSSSAPSSLEGKPLTGFPTVGAPTIIESHEFSGSTLGNSNVAENEELAPSETVDAEGRFVLGESEARSEVQTKPVSTEEKEVLERGGVSSAPVGERVVERPRRRRRVPRQKRAQGASLPHPRVEQIFSAPVEAVSEGNVAPFEKAPDSSDEEELEKPPPISKFKQMRIATDRLG